MKIFIRTLLFNTVQQKEIYRELLNELGFYCLSRGTNLDVYVTIEGKSFWDL